MWLQVLIVTLFLILLWHYSTKPSANHPPMPPWRLPLLGHIFYLIGYKHLQYAVDDLIPKYGKNGMLTIFLGPHIKFLFVDNLEFLKEAFRKDELNYRYGRDAVYDDIVGKMRGGGSARAGIING